MLRASRRSLIRNSCQYSSKSTEAQTEAKPARRKSFARRSKPAASRSPSQRAMSGLPRVPVLSAAPRIIQMDSFFAGGKPLLEITVHPQDRISSHSAPPDDTASVVDYEGSTIGPPDLSLKQEVKEHLAQLSAFQKPALLKPSTKGKKVALTHLESLQSDLLPPSYYQEQSTYLQSPYQSAHAASSFLDRAASHFKTQEAASLEKWLAVGTQQFRSEPPQTMRLAPKSAEPTPGKDAPDAVVQAVAEAFVKMMGGSRPVKILSVKPSGSNGQGVVVSFEVDETVPSTQTQTQAQGQLQGKEEILETSSELLQKQALADEGAEEPEEETAAFYVVDRPDKARISLGPRILARRGGRAVPRVNVRQLVQRMDSVKRKRRKAMSKHKYKKRRKATRSQRKKLGR